LRQKQDEDKALWDALLDQAFDSAGPAIVVWNDWLKLTTNTINKGSLSEALE
jgi:hypothetical protein